MTRQNASEAQTSRPTRPLDPITLLHVRRAEMRVVKGPNEGQKKEIHRQVILVGSSPECDFVLDDPAVSQRHFELLPTDGAGFRVRDLGSTNGTKIGGLSVRDATLIGGETISVGQTRIRLVVLNEEDEYCLSNRTAFGPLLGQSTAIRQVFEVLERSAQSDATLLLEGESGTGKSVAAESVHLASSRHEKPFVVVDCGSIQQNLVESELFGHKKGSFTGADQDRPGAFEAANGGTVFLDEIGEIDLSLQPKLLRLLENRELKRLGENTYRKVDVRLVAATNRDLAKEVKAGKFREDLFYRISVLRVQMPPLRSRIEDIGTLAKSFVRALDAKRDPDEVITDQALSMFLNHDWPGNVRELRNVVERLLIFPDRLHTVMPASENEADQANHDLMRIPFHEARRIWIDRFEKTYLTSVLDNADGVVAHAAEKAEIPRQTFHRLLTKHELSRRDRDKDKQSSVGKRKAR